MTRKIAKSLAGLAAGAVIAFSVTISAQAAEVLKISSWAPPTHQMNAIVFPTWIKKVEEATKGRVTGKIEYGLAPPPAQADLLLDGAADVTWIFHGYNPGRYVTTQLVELPGIETNAEALSVAYWRVYQKHLAKAAEHKGLVVLGLTSHSQGILHTREEIKTLEDISGKKIRIGGGVSGAVGKALGVVGVQVPAPKVYETVASGVADGVMMPMESKKSFRLMEVAPYSLIMPGGFYYGSFAFLMSKERFEGLSKEDQDAIMSVSGEMLSQLAGKAWDDADVVGEKAVLEAGNKISTATPEMLAQFKEKIKHIEPEVLAASAKKGVDAEAALKEMRDIAVNYGK